MGSVYIGLLVGVYWVVAGLSIRSFTLAFRRRGMSILVSHIIGVTATIPVMALAAWLAYQLPFYDKGAVIGYAVGAIISSSIIVFWVKGDL